MKRGPLTETNVTFAETTFVIHKALPMEAFAIFEAMRPGLSEASEAVRKAFAADAKGISREANFLGLAMEIIGRMPEDIVKTAMSKLMQHVYWKRAGSGPSQKVSLDLESAFRGMTVFQIYELLVRAFIVNFTESFDDLRSLWSALQAEDSSAPGI